MSGYPKTRLSNPPVQEERTSSGDWHQSPSSYLLTGLQILVVDDDTDTRNFLTTVLEQHGAKVTAVASVSKALEALQNLMPDVLVSDIGMPGEDGYGLIRKVRALEAERGGKIPAIALTAYASDEERMRSLSAGFQMHLPKPVEPAELIAVVANFNSCNSFTQSH
jgi:CheY-like chemotaxis protein